MQVGWSPKYGMTYDRVQFSLNKHHYLQIKDSELDRPVNPTHEVEKVSISPVRRKPSIFSCESPLSNNSEIDALSHGDRKSVYQRFETNGCYAFEKESKKYEELDCRNTEGHEKQSVTPLFAFKQSTSEIMSDSTRSRHVTGNGSDVNNSEIRSKSGSIYENDSGENVSENSSKRRGRELDTSDEKVKKRTPRIHSLSNKHSNKGGVASSFSDFTNNLSKNQSFACEHMLASYSSTHDLTTKKKYEVYKNKMIAPNKCMICEVTEATANYASVEANRLLLEIVYPHEFYDKFQRSGKRTRVLSNPKISENTKEQLNICKPVPVASKPLRRERTTILPSQSNEQPERADPPPTSLRESFRNRLMERSETELTPQKRFKRDGEGEPKREVHLQCKAKNNILVVTDDSAGQKLVLKGLKGWILKKDDLCKNNMHKEIKKSLYQVNSLGMKFSIPEYNTSLTERKPKSAREYSYITTPCPLDVQPPTRKSLTQCTSPHHNLTPPTDVQTGQSRTMNGLHRGYTQVPKLFSDSMDSFKGFHMTKVSANNSGNLSENTTTLHKGNTNVSLPPIPNNLKSRSLTLSQF